VKYQQNILCNENIEWTTKKICSTNLIIIEWIWRETPLFFGVGCFHSFLSKTLHRNLMRSFTILQIQGSVKFLEAEQLHILPFRDKMPNYSFVYASKNVLRHCVLCFSAPTMMNLCWQVYSCRALWHESKSMCFNTRNTKGSERVWNSGMQFHVPDVSGCTLRLWMRRLCFSFFALAQKRRARKSRCLSGFNSTPPSHGAP
jgi:hypothetical protein